MASIINYLVEKADDKMFVYKVHSYGSDRLLAIADAELIGKTFSEGELDITISDSFYGSEKCDKEKAIQLARTATIINAMGNGIVSLLAESKIVDKTNVLRIDTILHAQVVVVV